MNIVVTVKQVPDPDIPPNHFRVDEAANAVVPPQGVAPVMNGYDANALEAALRLKERHGGQVTVVTLGGAEARDTLKRALAMGADAAVLVDDPALRDGDSFTTATALAKAIEKIGEYDLILCGRQASDTDAGQVALGIGELLRLPAISPVIKIEVADGGARVDRMAEDGHQVVEVPLPALLAVSSEIGEPRYPPLRGIMAAGRAQIPVWSAADLGLDPAAAGPRARLRRLYVERGETQCELIEADSPAEAGAALAQRLREAKLI
jgi:electron transfer flavoprotein beta subunit